jgi:predicted nucleotidyltransferase
MNPEFVKKTDTLEKAIEIIIRSVDPEKIILFGSRARGDHKKESDYMKSVVRFSIFRAWYGISTPPGEFEK